MLLGEQKVRGGCRAEDGRVMVSPKRGIDVMPERQCAARRKGH